MKTYTTKDTESRREEVIDTASFYKEVGVQGFIKDEYANEKSKNRLKLDALIKQGILKSTDASVFHCLNKKLTVKFNYDAY